MKTSDNSSSPSPPVRAAIKSAADDASKAVSVNAAAAAAAADEPEDHSALMYIDDSYIPGVGSGIEDYGNATLGLFPKDSLVGQATLDFIPSESIVGEVAKTFLDDSGGGGKPACTLERSLTTVTTTADDVSVVSVIPIFFLRECCYSYCTVCARCRGKMSSKYAYSRVVCLVRNAQRSAVRQTIKL